MANVQLLDENGVNEALQEGDVEVFRYQLNRVGYTIVLLVGGLMLAGAGYIWWGTGLAENFWTAVFAGLTAGGLGLSIHAAYWYAFSSVHFVAVSDQKLVVGRQQKAWAIDWSVLDAEALGFEEMNNTAMRGALDVHVGGQDIKIHLYNAYVFLEDIQGFIFSLLKRLQQKQSAGGEQADNADEAAASD